MSGSGARPKVSIQGKEEVLVGALLLLLCPRAREDQGA